MWFITVGMAGSLMCLCCDLVLFGLFGLRMETCVIFQTLDQKVKHFHYVHMLSCGPCVNTEQKSETPQQKNRCKTTFDCDEH